jgi:hypothetical protein
VTFRHAGQAGRPVVRRPSCRRRDHQRRAPAKGDDGCTLRGAGRRDRPARTDHDQIGVDVVGHLQHGGAGSPERTTTWTAIPCSRMPGELVAAAVRSRACPPARSGGRGRAGRAGRTRRPPRRSASHRASRPARRRPRGPPAIPATRRSRPGRGSAGGLPWPTASGTTSVGTRAACKEPQAGRSECQPGTATDARAPTTISEACSRSAACSRTPPGCRRRPRCDRRCRRRPAGRTTGAPEVAHSVLDRLVELARPPGVRRCTATTSASSASQAHRPLEGGLRRAIRPRRPRSGPPSRAQRHPSRSPPGSNGTRAAAMVSPSSGRRGSCRHAVTEQHLGGDRPGEAGEVTVTPTTRSSMSSALDDRSSDTSGRQDGVARRRHGVARSASGARVSRRHHRVDAGVRTGAAGHGPHNQVGSVTIRLGGRRPR